MKKILELKKMNGPVGAECAGSDVAGLDPRAVHSALLEHQLLVFRDQTLTPQTFTRFAQKLGELDIYPFAEPLPGAPHVVKVVKEPGDNTNFGGDWHTDTSYTPEPPSVTLLYAVEVPGEGGDTLFADMYRAFDSLSEGYRIALSSLVGHNTADLVHDTTGSHASVVGEAVALKDKDQDIATQADHPIVRVHPETGRAALFFSLIHTASISGMTRPESLPLLEHLHRHATAAENCSRLSWRPGTLAIWDNRCLQHYPLNDYPGQRREMHRIILKGDRPVGLQR